MCDKRKTVVTWCGQKLVFSFYRFYLKNKILPWKIGDAHAFYFIK